MWKEPDTNTVNSLEYALVCNTVSVGYARHDEREQRETHPGGETIAYLALLGPSRFGSKLELAVRALSGIAPLCMPRGFGLSLHCSVNTQRKKLF